MIPASHDAAWYRDKLTVSGVPAHMHEGYLRYLLNGIRPGDFLCAVLENNLRDALLRADPGNRPTLIYHVRFLLHHGPAACWGSPEHVTAWIASFHTERTV